MSMMKDLLQQAVKDNPWLQEMLNDAEKVKAERLAAEQLEMGHQETDRQRKIEEQKARNAAINQSKTLWSCQIRVEPYHMIYCVIWADTFEEANMIATKAFPNVEMIFIERADCSKNMIEIGMYIE